MAATPSERDISIWRADSLMPLFPVALNTVLLWLPRSPSSAKRVMASVTTDCSRSQLRRLNVTTHQRRGQGAWGETEWPYIIIIIVIIMRL